MLRFHQNRQMVHCAYVYLACFILDWQTAKTHQRYYQEDDLDKKYWDILAQYFGNKDGDGQLQSDLNKSHNGILVQLKKDFPHLSREEILIFSYYATGLPVPLMQILAGISFDKSVSIMKTQLKRQILTKASPRREEYLLLLEREKLPNWVRNAIFA